MNIAYAMQYAYKKIALKSYVCALKQKAFGFPIPVFNEKLIFSLLLCGIKIETFFYAL